MVTARPTTSCAAFRKSVCAGSEPRAGAAWTPCASQYRTGPRPIRTWIDPPIPFCGLLRSHAERHGHVRAVPRQLVVGRALARRHARIGAGSSVSGARRASREPRRSGLEKRPGGTALGIQHVRGRDGRPEYRGCQAARSTWRRRGASGLYRNRS